MTSREGPWSSEHTGVFISWSRIRYLLSIWQSLASRLEYYRECGGYLRPDRRGIKYPREHQVATKRQAPSHRRRGGDRVEGKRLVYVTSHIPSLLGLWHGGPDANTHISPGQLKGVAGTRP